MVEKFFDVAVLGSGPGGYPAAIKCAQGGLSVALIEAQDLGGTCLNRGCIPTKTLIANTDVLRTLRQASSFGIECSSIRFNFSQMKQRKDDVVSKIRKSLEGLIQANSITIVRGFGTFISPNEIKVVGQDNCIIRAKKFIIATGSEPKELNAFAFDHQQILSSTSILDLSSLPKSLLIVGGGVIGCEFASLYAELGVKVTILEALDRILPLECPSVSSHLAKVFTKRGIKVVTSNVAKEIKKMPGCVIAMLQDGQQIEAEIALIAVGRSLNSDKIGLDKTGVTVDPRGFIVVNDRMETSVPGVYAIGDVTAKSMYAHAASHQGIIAANNILGHTSTMSYNAVPGVIFTHPEIGTVGLSLDQAKEKGYDAKIGTFPFQALGKSQASLQTDGFAQIVVDTKTGQILGAQVIGHEAAILIAEMALAIANELTVECIAETIHAHPTLSEAWHETSLLSLGEPLHLPPQRRRV